MELPYDLTIPLVGTHPEKTTIRKDPGAPVFTAALFTTAKTWNQPRCPSAEVWIKRCVTCATECCSAAKMNGTMPSAATWMDLEIVRLSEVSQTEADIT